VTDPEAYAALRERAAALAAACPGTQVGSALHSLRAVAPAGLRQVLDGAGAGPVHIHVAEQTREVDACLAWSGARPVQWLLDHAPVDDRWCLVHATHMDDSEATRLAECGAVAGLCPVTEANLGDGFCPATKYLAAGGSFGIGTDSNVSIQVADELRQLEYSQRLNHRARNVIGAGDSRSTGRVLFEGALRGGAQALGMAGSGIAEGATADFVSLRSDVASFAHRRDDAWLDTWIFAGAGHCIDSVWRAGRKLVSSGRHHARDEVSATYLTALKRLLAEG
jgi:formiminoglutamate deiminase